jgi:hypothetical protein
VGRLEVLVPVDRRALAHYQGRKLEGPPANLVAANLAGVVEAIHVDPDIRNPGNSDP